MKPDQPLMKTRIVIFATLAAMLPAAQAKEPFFAPDLVIFNGSIRTMDQTQPTAEAVAVVGNRIAAVGSTKEIRALAGPKTRVIDAAKRTVFPGFNDAHVHFLMGGFSLA